ncbi:hypothetical protein ACTFIV_008478 [Dictyostelium citrinum]
MKSHFFIFFLLIIVTALPSKCSSDEIVKTKCYSCLNENEVCQTIENDIYIESNETLICNDKLKCISVYSQPSMHPNRTSLCSSYQGQYGSQCEGGNEGFCGYQMMCDYRLDTYSPMCIGFRTLQPGEKCITDNECQSLVCDKEKLVCIENEYSCSVNTYWNGMACVNILNTGDKCTSDTQCSIFNTCNNGICIEKYSLNEDYLCISDLACNISNSLICTKGKCQVFKNSNTTNCKVDGCLKDYEYCNCYSGKCEQSKIFNDECKDIQYQLDSCVYGRCVYTNGYISKNSCVMKNCGSLVCQHHSKCTNGPCGNNNSSFCNTITPNNSDEFSENNSSNSSNGSYLNSSNGSYLNSANSSHYSFSSLLFIFKVILLILHF